MTHQYDQYAQAFTLADDSGTAITPSMVESVRLLINDTEYVYEGESTDTLIYSTSALKWYALLTKEQTGEMRSMTVQVEVDFGNDTVFTSSARILHSDTQRVRLSPSLDWSDDE